MVRESGAVRTYLMVVMVVVHLLRLKQTPGWQLLPPVVVVWEAYAANIHHHPTVLYRNVYRVGDAPSFVVRACVRWHCG